MNLDLTGKTALVTGSTAGIGLAIAKSLAGEGVDVVINGRTEERVKSAVMQVKGKVRGVAADLSNTNEIKRLLQEVPEVDILINNFGIYEVKTIEDLNADDFQRLFYLNVVTGFELTKHYLTGMKKKGWGRVQFISSESGVNIPPEMIHYGVSKAAQIAIARGFAESTSGTAITVNSVLPGPTYSEGIRHFLDSVPNLAHGRREEIESEFVKKHRPTSLLQRFATAEEVASLVTYLASPLATATNGAAVRVEGGLLRGIL